MNNKNKIISRILPFIKFTKNNNSNLKYYEHLLDFDHAFYIEEYFHDMLYMERKRAERSLKPFLLMLVNISDILNGKGNNDNEKRIYIRKVSNVLCSCKRETDIAGWYKYNSIIGVILTETAGLNKHPFRQKIHDNLNNIIDPGLVKKIKISFHIFPEKDIERNPDTYMPDRELYPKRANRHYLKKTSVIIKRCIDIILSSIFIILFSPLYLAIPILIKLTSDGPVLFKQKRMGQFAREFNFLKFRTMHVNNEDDIHEKYIEHLIRKKENVNETTKNNGNGRIYKINNDPRVTPIGAILRKSSMDELPQFLNVLKGEMSIVGPRPPIPYEVKHYNVWHKRRIRWVKPGITGIWQVEGRSRTTFDEMVRMDIRYMRGWSVSLDLKILLKTPLAVLSGKGAM
jgi:lipopolysaccharide/colanic/teichoic acid biosynthesis glycosyltransferase